MINITRNKRLYAEHLIKQVNYLELKMFRSLKPVLNKTFRETADLIKHGDPLNVVPVVVNRFSEENRKLFRKQYYLVGNWVYKQVIDRLQEINPKKISDYYYKDALNNFWYWYNTFVNKQVAAKVTKIDNTTKDILRSIIDKGIRDNKSYLEIAKDLEDNFNIANKNRAIMIAMTETHSAFNFAQNKSIETQNVKIDTKEWMNAGDERVRKSIFNHRAANGEKVKMSEAFVNTGEPLMYPGDPAGSAANIIRCRCVQLFNTDVTEIGG